MQRTISIAKREFFAYFNSPIAYIVLTVFLLAVGILFFIMSGFFIVNEATMRGFFNAFHHPMFPVFPLFAAAVTMRLIAEEKRQGTFEILVTLPVRDVEIILGKYLAALMFLAAVLILTLGYPITVSLAADMDWGPILGGYMGLLLLGASYLAIGLLASSLTEHQVIAFFSAIVISFSFYYVSYSSAFLPASIASFVQYMSFTYHFNNLSRGVVDSRDVLFFLSIIVAALAGATLALKARKWR
ncbi:MAG: ABC transporter permease subunit [Deltaproteobacteria bacterium]|nr:ABC transporter permease subunit [Deltaproteobacteria bacterium]